jgi:hypothetical protein
MDPYIEHPEVWSDFHGGLAAEIRAELNTVILPRYVARMTPWVTYETVETMKLPLRLFTVVVRETGTLRLVAAIEILSPVNKQPGHEAHDEYLRKRRELLRSGAHLMEIDLLRGGRRPPLERPVPSAPYYVTLSRVHRRPYVEVWPIQLREKLPTVPVPLLEPDPDAPLDLAAVVSRVYERGGYAVIIDYSQPPPPPLSDEDAAWLDEHLRTHKAR